MDIRKALQELSQAAKDCDAGDLAGMAGLHSRLGRIREWAVGNAQPLIAQNAAGTMGLLEKAIWQGGFPPSIALDSARQVSVVFHALVGIESGGVEKPSAPQSKKPEYDPALLKNFLDQVPERLASVRVHLLSLESNPQDREALWGVFRAFGAIHRTSWNLRLHDMAQYTVAVANILERVERRKLDLASGALDALFEATDTLEEYAERTAKAVEAGRPVSEPSPDLAERIHQLNALAAHTRNLREGVTALQADPAALAKLRLGEMLVREGVASAEGIESALHSQEAGPGKQRVGDILVEKGIISRAQLDEALRIQNEDPSLGKVGDILIEMGAVTEDDIKHALTNQKAPQRQKLGEVLVRSGQAPARSVAKVIRKQSLVKDLVRYGLEKLAQLGAEEAPAEVKRSPSFEGMDLELVAEFVERSKEHLDTADIQVLALESDPDNRAAMDAAHRAFRNIARISGYLGLNDITEYARAAEGLVDAMRAGAAPAVGPVIDLCFDCVAGLRKHVDFVEKALKTGEPLEKDEGLESALAYIGAVASGEKKAIPVRPKFKAGQRPKRLGEILIESGITTKEGLEAALRAQGEDLTPKRLGDILIEQAKVSKTQIRKAIEAQKQDASNAKLGDILVKMGIVEPGDIAEALELQKNPERPKLGEILVRSGQASAKAVARALRSQRLFNQMVRAGTAAAIASGAIMGAMPAAHAASAAVDTGGAMVYVMVDSDADLDSDGLADNVELMLGLNTDSIDSDQDGLPDGWEVFQGLNPADAADAMLDADGDGLTNLQEYELGTNPFQRDTDGDGFWDGLEVERGASPADAGSQPFSGVYGDVNRDGKVDSADIQMVTLGAMGVETPAPADVDGAGGVSAVDVQEVIRAAMDLPDQNNTQENKA